MKEYKRYLVTSALPYANGPLHIGHLSGAYLSADIYVRFLRSTGKDVAFICGSDEHGAAITMRALKDKTTPQEIVDRYHKSFKQTFKDIGISFDHYHRTSDPIHHETSQEFFLQLAEKGEFEIKETEQFYDEKAKKFLADRYIMGTCPKCSHEKAYGDQCENCGSSLSPLELINPVSTITGEKPELKKTKHWYLPLDKYSDWLNEWINDGTIEGKYFHDPSTWKNHVLGQCKSWIDGGLHPRAMTRDLNWGVDVPKQLEGSEGKKLYVWMDAPIGYISSTKAWAKENNKNWEEYWKDDETALVHFIGKDNIVFHCIIFPAILKANGNYILPMNVPANQFMNLEGQKISTSRNWAVWVDEYIKDFPNREDELRYVMVKNMPEQKDSEFTWKSYQDAVNNELVNNLANFINRVVVLINKYYDGVVPAFDEDLQVIGPEGDIETSFHDAEMLTLFDDLDHLSSQVRKYDFRGAMSTLMSISAKGNQILQFNEPWKNIKEDPESVKVAMNLACQYVVALTAAMRPFMPFSSDKLIKQLNLDVDFDNGGFNDLMQELAEGYELIKSGHKIGAPIHLFTRVDDEAIKAQIDKLNSNKEEASAVTNGDMKPTIQFDDFTKLDLKTATILEAEQVPKADKLLKLSVDLGFEQRTVVSGIAEHFKADDVIGKQVVLVTNLAPRKIRGVESQGMILMADDEDGKLCFVSPEIKWKNGMTIS